MSFYFLLAGEKYEFYNENPIENFFSFFKGRRIQKITPTHAPPTTQHTISGTGP